MKHIHILGIGGTFMGGLALLARAQGFRVSGSDANIYPPMSTQLQSAGIDYHEGYLPDHLQPVPDTVIIGNALSRGWPVVESVLDQGIPYTSGPQWLAEQVLAGRQVLAVAGTHGKTTTSSMLAFILDRCGFDPGFLIGGVAKDFGISARLGSGPFVIEADEYDTAFFDKRAKFVHYHPEIAVLNNLEFDHADIYPDLAAIQRQFHHLIRTVPGRGRIIAGEAANLDAVLTMGCWTPVERFGQDDWQAREIAADGSRFVVYHHDRPVGQVEWTQLGDHNVRNALAAIAAAAGVGADPAEACRVLTGFGGVKRRLELRGRVGGVEIYDDFAHHPTAVATTLAGLRAHITGQGRLIAVLEPRSNTMRMGVFREPLAEALSLADQAVIYQPPELGWDMTAVTAAMPGRSILCASYDEMLLRVVEQVEPGDRVVLMSNGGFGGLHQRLLDALADKKE